MFAPVRISIKLKQYLKIKNSCSSKIYLLSPSASLLQSQRKRGILMVAVVVVVHLLMLPAYFPNISRHFINFSFSSSRNSASTQARKYSEPKQSSQHIKSCNRTKRKSKETESFHFRPEHSVEIAHCRRRFRRWCRGSSVCLFVPRKVSPLPANLFPFAVDTGL